MKTDLNGYMGYLTIVIVVLAVCGTCTYKDYSKSKGKHVNQLESQLKAARDSINDEIKRKREKAEADSASPPKYVYEDRIGCLHASRKCKNIHSYYYNSDKHGFGKLKQYSHEPMNYAVRFVRTTALKTTMSFCCECVDEELYEKIEDIIRLNNLERNYSFEETLREAQGD